MKKKLFFSSVLHGLFGLMQSSILTDLTPSHQTHVHLLEHIGYLELDQQLL